MSPLKPLVEKYQLMSEIDIYSTSTVEDKYRKEFDDIASKFVIDHSKNQTEFIDFLAKF